MSAETAQRIPKFERAPLIIPQGKYTCMVARDALLSAAAEGSWDSVFSTDGSVEIRESHRNRLSCNTKVPYKTNKGNLSKPKIRFLAPNWLWVLKHTLWFVFKLSICFLKSSDQKSLQMNFIASRWSLKRGLSIVYLESTKTANKECK